jgi:DNA-damage-inducible protein J
MATKNVTIRMDEKLKEDSEKLFDELGINMTTAIIMFVKQSVREQRIPFQLTLKTPNMETVAAIVESEKLMKDESVKRFTKMADLMKDLEDDEI